MHERPPFRPPEILLLGPGPSPVSHRVLAAMGAPVLGHLDPDFLALMERVAADLRVVFGTSNPMTLALSATGTGGMEACIGSLVEPGDRVVCGVHGYFGERMLEMARRHGGDTVAVRADYGQALDLAAVIDAIGSGPTRVVTLVHAETSTGVLQPVEAICQAARRHGALVILDCVTSLGGVPVELDEWGVAAAYSGSQKCLGAPPGLSPVSLSEAALAKIRGRQRPSASFYFDFGLLQGYWGSGSAGGVRAYHHTAPISSVYALAAGLDDALEEGLEARWQRHRDCAAALYRGLAPLGIRCLVEERVRLPMLTSIVLPDGLDPATVQKHLRQQHGIEVGAGLGPLKGKILRIGLMGHGARLTSVTRVLAALAAAR